MTNIDWAISVSFRNISATLLHEEHLGPRLNIFELLGYSNSLLHELAADRLGTLRSIVWANIQLVSYHSPRRSQLSQDHLVI